MRPGTLSGPPLLTPREALAMARPLLARRPLLVTSDFDGTLADLSPDPWAPRILPLAQAALRTLAGIPDVEVALLSGRGADDLAGRVRVGGATYLGDHGAEAAYLPRRARRLEHVLPRQPPDRAAQKAATALADGVPRLVPDPWLVVERKLPSVCFHFRSAPDPDVARSLVTHAVDVIDPLRLLVRTHRRRSLELRPAGAVTKGPAMTRLIALRRPAAVILLGDDPNDAAAFAALREAGRSSGPAGLAVAVTSHPEWLADIGPHADLVLGGAAAAARFLAALARALARSTRR